MPIFFFDIDDGEMLYDRQGTECESIEEVRERIMVSLPEIAGWITPTDGDDQAIKINVRDDSGNCVYTATLTYAGYRPNRESVQ